MAESIMILQGSTKAPESSIVQAGSTKRDLLDLPEEIQEQIFMKLIPAGAIVQIIDLCVPITPVGYSMKLSKPNITVSNSETTSTTTNTSNSILQTIAFINESIRLYEANAPAGDCCMNYRGFDGNTTAFPSAIFAICHKIRHRILPGYYGSNQILFRHARHMQPFLSTLSPSMATQIQEVRLDIQIKFWSKISENQEEPEAVLGSVLSYVSASQALQALDRLRTLRITLNVDDCSLQHDIGKALKASARKCIDMRIDIIVTATSCSHCDKHLISSFPRTPDWPTRPFQMADARQFWEWKWRAETSDWEVRRYLVQGNSRVELKSLADFLIQHRNNAIIDRAAAMLTLKELVEKLRGKGCGNVGENCKHEGFSVGRRCGGIQPQPCTNLCTGFPKNFLLSRALWCQKCELVFFCGRCGAHGEAHGRFCIKKP